MNKFVINGTGGSGKDEFIKIFAEKWNDFMYNISSIDPVKDIAFYLGWMGGKTDKDRKMLSDLKKICIEYNDLPIKYVSDHIKRAEDKVIFIHIREGDEIDKLKSYYPDIKTILIDRKMDLKGNKSDDDVYNYNYDYIIDNNGTIEHLTYSVDLFIEEIKNA